VLSNGVLTWSRIPWLFHGARSSETSKGCKMQTLTRLTAQPAGNGSYLLRDRETRKTLRQDLERGISKDSTILCVFESIELQIITIYRQQHMREIGSTDRSVRSLAYRISIPIPILGCLVLGSRFSEHILLASGGSSEISVGWLEKIRFHLPLTLQVHSFKLEFSTLLAHFSFVFILVFYNSFVGFLFFLLWLLLGIVVGHRAPRSWDKYTLFGLFATKKFKSIKRFNKFNKFFNRHKLDLFSFGIFVIIIKESKQARKGCWGWYICIFGANVLFTNANFVSRL